MHAIKFGALYLTPSPRGQRPQSAPILGHDWAAQQQYFFFELLKCSLADHRQRSHMPHATPRHKRKTKLSLRSLHYLQQINEDAESSTFVQPVERNKISRQDPYSFRIAFLVT